MLFRRNQNRNSIIWSSQVTNIFGELRSLIIKVSIEKYVLVPSFSWVCRRTGCDKMPCENDLGKKGFLLIYSSGEIESVMTGEAWKQSGKARGRSRKFTGHIFTPTQQTDGRSEARQ